MTTVKEALNRVCSEGLDRLDAELLLAHSLDRTRTWLYTWPDYQPDAAQLLSFQSLVERRLQGEPVAYLTGIREFWSLPVRVDNSTLIPRPDTEILVEAVLARLPKQQCFVADLGAGTGAIALALAYERPEWHLTAIDREPAAVALARYNAQALELPICIEQGDWCMPLADNSQDAIVTNPPYIDASDPHLMEGDVRFEPLSALVAEREGLGAIHQIAEQAPRVLKDPGWLFIEHGWQQGSSVRALLNARGFSRVETLKDLAGNDRVTLGCWSTQ